MTFYVEYLDLFGFPTHIKEWVKILYTDIKSSVTNNGWHSEYFDLGRGVLQGCPLSPYLFILCAEILAMQTRDNAKIEGINIGNKNYKILQYADDTQLFTKFKAESINAILKTFGEFTKVSGLKINFDKSEVLRIGQMKNSNLRIKTDLELKWTNEPLKVLGINVSPNLNEILDKNITPNNWENKQHNKNLGTAKAYLFGKTTVIKSLLESQLIYRLSVLPSPKIETLRHIDKILFDFLWDKKPHKIKKRSSNQAKIWGGGGGGGGGLGMVDIHTKNMALKVAWIKRIIEGKENGVYPTLVHYLSKIWHWFVV